MKRQSTRCISQNLRDKILCRDGFCCQYPDCSNRYQPLEAQHLVIHHLDSDKSNNAHANLATVCRSCHNTIHNTLDAATRRYRRMNLDLDAKWPTDQTLLFTR